MRTRWATALAVAVLAGALAAPNAASASTTEAIADTGGMELTISGVSPLDITVTLDEIGHVTEVAVSGEDEPIAGEDDHRVRFSSEDDGTRISVQAKNHRLAADVKTSGLADLVGDHTWAAPLFGSDTNTVVNFEVIDTGELVVGTVDTDAEAYEIGEVKTETEDDEADSSVKITFTNLGYTMTLKIQVSMDSDDDESSAKLKIVLRGKDVQTLRRQAIQKLVGEHTWDGHMCDGTPISVIYDIDEDGTVTPDGGKGEPEIKTMPHGFVAEWDGSKAKVTVELKEKQDGEWDLKVRSKSTDKCNPSDDRARGDDDDAEDDESHERGRSDKDKKEKKNKDDDDDEEDDD